MQSWLVAGAAIACCWGRGLGRGIKLYCVCMCRVVTCRVFLVSCSFVMLWLLRAVLFVCLFHGFAKCPAASRAPRWLLVAGRESPPRVCRREQPQRPTTIRTAIIDHDGAPSVCESSCVRAPAPPPRGREGAPPTAESAERRRSSLVAGCRHSAFVVDGACRPVGAKARGRSQLWCRRCLFVVSRRYPAIEPGADENARS